MSLGEDTATLLVARKGCARAAEEYSAHQMHQMILQCREGIRNSDENASILQTAVDRLETRLHALEAMLRDSKFDSFQDEAAFHACIARGVFHVDLAYYILVRGNKGVYPEKATEWLCSGNPGRPK